MKYPIAPLAVALCLSLPAHAEKADKQKPMNIESDALRYEDLKQTSVFTGNVIITKGTMVMRGTRIDVRQDAEGYQYALVQSAPGVLAYFKQKREGADETMEGESEVVEYDGRADVIKFVKTAVLRRYKGTALNDETQGSLITYDNVTDVFTVEGKATATASNPGGRVRTMLTPRDTTVQGSGAALPAPAQLRPSAQLGTQAAPSAKPGEKK